MHEALITHTILVNKIHSLLVWILILKIKPVLASTWKRSEIIVQESVDGTRQIKQDIHV